MDAAGTGQAPQIVQLSCTFSKPLLAPAGFEKEFCEALAGKLSRELGATFQLTEPHAWKGSGKAVSVSLHMLTKSRADVTTVSGQVTDGVFTPGASTKSTIQSTDAPLRPAASQALVRGIGLLIGLLPS